MSTWPAADEAPQAAARRPWPYPGLPAPWEPLPAWPAGAGPDTAPESGIAPRALPAPVGAASATTSQPPATGAGSAAVTHEAATGRILRAEEPSTAASQPRGATATPAVAPDLDSLARQVYTVLRRRLAAEYRQSR